MHKSKEESKVAKEEFSAAVSDTILNYERLWESYRIPEERPRENPPPAVDPRILEDRLLKEMQEQEFLEAKRLDEERKKAELEAERRQIEVEKAQAEAEKIEKEREEAAQREKAERLAKKRREIPAEPEKTEEGVCEIAFRFPSGKRVIRKFHKETTIGTLYNYVDCLDQENVAEEKYELTQTMPRKAYKNMEATLEAEKLYPKALIQIEVTEEL